MWSQNALKKERWLYGPQHFICFSVNRFTRYCVAISCNANNHNFKNGPHILCFLLHIKPMTRPTTKPATAITITYIPITLALVFNFPATIDCDYYCDIAAI